MVRWKKETGGERQRNSEGIEKKKPFKNDNNLRQRRKCAGVKRKSRQKRENPVLHTHLYILGGGESTEFSCCFI